MSDMTSIDMDLSSLENLSQQAGLGALKLMIESGVDINVMDLAGVTPLIRAISTSNRDIVSYLIDHGADLNAQEFVGENALHKVVREQSLDDVTFCIKAGSNLEAKNALGR